MIEKHAATRHDLMVIAETLRTELVRVLQRSGVSLADNASMSTTLSIARHQAETRGVTEAALLGFEAAVRAPLEAYLKSLPDSHVPRWDSPIASVIVDHFNARGVPLDDGRNTLWHRVVKWFDRAFTTP